MISPDTVGCKRRVMQSCVKSSSVGKRGVRSLLLDQTDNSRTFDRRSRSRLEKTASSGHRGFAEWLAPSVLLRRSHHSSGQRSVNGLDIYSTVFGSLHQLHCKRQLSERCFDVFHRCFDGLTINKYTAGPSGGLFGNPQLRRAKSPAISINKPRLVKLAIRQMLRLGRGIQILVRRS